MFPSKHSFRIIVLAFSLISGRADAEPVTHPHVTVDLISDVASIQPGRSFHVGVLFDLEKDWHVYWRNPGDSGEAPRIQWMLSEDVTVGEVEWPAPYRIPVGPFVNFGYEKSALLTIPFSASNKLMAGESVTITADISWLVCKEECIPGKGRFTVSLPVRDESPVASASAALFEEFRQKRPTVFPSDGKVFYEVKPEKIHLILDPDVPIASEDVFFFPQDPDKVAHSASQTLQVQDGVATLSLTKSEYFSAPTGSLKGVLRTAKEVFEINASPRTGSAPGIGLVLLLAFAGGVLLNLMPCVFPVLSLKALHFLKGSSEPKTLRLHALLYLLGILVSFWALAALLFILRSGGSQIGWGFQLQSPAVVSLLASLFFLMSLYLLGVFHWSQSLMGVGHGLASRRGSLGAFMTGVLATIVATPCTAPFMATALGFALTQPPLINFAIFSLLGLGLAFPYVLLSWTPALFRYLPKPGRWMDIFKQFMAFPLLATALWLAWVLGRQAGVTAVLLLMGSFLLLGMAAWMWGLRAGKRTQTLAALIALSVLVGLPFGFRWLPGNVSHEEVVNSGIPWEVYSAERVQDLLAQRKPIFLNFTAAWCISCQVNNLTTLRSSEVVRAFQEHGIVGLKADWTNQNAEITQALRQFKRSGVPVYVYYSGVEGEAPRVLPSLLTPNMVLKELGIKN